MTKMPSAFQHADISSVGLTEEQRWKNLAFAFFLRLLFFCFSFILLLSGVNTHSNKSMPNKNVALFITSCRNLSNIKIHCINMYFFKLFQWKTRECRQQHCKQGDLNFCSRCLLAMNTRCKLLHQLKIKEQGKITGNKKQHFKPFKRV